jgi:tetratricopeptide (TPR) repeat protein
MIIPATTSHAGYSAPSFEAGGPRRTSTFGVLLFVFAVLAATAHADLKHARELLSRDPAAASEHLRALLARKPDDPWLLYDAGVAAYAAKDFAGADELWQQLAASPLPDKLRDQVWVQIGNVSYRLAQPKVEPEPDIALPRLEQSREAFRVAISFNKRNQVAADNLRFVESELEKLYARLAKQLVQDAKKEEWNHQRTIERLQAALSYARQAEALNPQNAERQQERREIEMLLAEALNRSAAAHEKAGDERDQENSWERDRAKEEWEKAIENFKQAQAAAPEDRTAREGEKRVEQKLANLFDKAGRQEQRQAQQAAKSDPEEAVEKFESALENFQQALAHVPEHADAQAGEREVRQQLAQLHLDQGDRQAERGEQQAQRDAEQAAENLLSALDHFQQAQALTPQNAEIPPRIERAQLQLAPLLTQVGQREQRNAEYAEERRQLDNAVNHLERAETSFDKAQQISPGDEAAQEGQREVQQALARLRQKMDQRNGKPNQPQRAPQSPQEARESFESMLARWKDDLRRRETHARHHAGQRYTEQRDTALRDW